MKKATRRTYPKENCGHCGALISTRHWVCPECKQRTQWAPELTYPTNECPKCRADNPMIRSFCVQCDAKLKEAVSNAAGVRSEAQRLREAKREGQKFARLIVSGAGCCSECRSVAARGAIPINEAPVPGSLKCGKYCDCIYVTGRGPDL